MSDSTSLACETTAIYVSKNIICCQCLCEIERLSYDSLKCLETKVIVDVSAVNNNLTCSGNQSNSGYRSLSSACALILLNLSHLTLPPSLQV